MLCDKGNYTCNDNKIIGHLTKAYNSTILHVYTNTSSEFLICFKHGPNWINNG